ncbi:MAG TPA: aspartate aminotransferase family protein [Candidatus Limnocylindrales bacterium]|nr:aspartate aminotransferase family protein [Candidatus Limnocylindrales bacterium]
MTAEVNLAGSLFTLDPTRAYPVLDRADGVYVWDVDGRRYLDAIAGIGVANLGYGRGEVVQAIAEQAARLPFAVGNIFANEPAMRLAEAIARVAPGDLDSVHFTSGGSEAVEVALKMARQYHVIRGEPDRSVVISRWTSYHGATIGGLTVGGSKLRRRVYEPLLPETPHVRTPYCYRCPWPEAHPDCAAKAADELDAAIVAAGPGRVAAFIAEPIVASVGGAIRPPDDYWPRVREICDRFGVLLIVDEVVTGFGRTGRPFAVDHWSVVPDLLVMGKGLSGGYAPLGAVAARRQVRAAFVDAGAVFEHIFTFGGNPIAAAAGLAVLAIWERERLTENVARLEPAFAAALDGLRRHRFVGDVRVSGFMAGIEFVADRTTREPFPPEMRLGARVREAGLRNGIVTYPGSGMADGIRGDIVSLYPPLTFSPDDIAEAADRLDATFAEVGRGLEV